MADYSQEVVDALIEHIKTTLKKGSVTNVQVAAILDFLNTRQSDSEGIYLSKVKRDVAQELIEFLKGIIVTGESEFKDRTTFRKGLTAYSTSTEGAGNGITEGEESEIIEVDASEFSTTIGGLENVSDAADNASAGSILSFDGAQWAVIASQSDTATDIANMLVPVWHTVLQKMIFVPCSIFGSGQVVTNNKFPYTLPLILS